MKKEISFGKIDYNGCGRKINEVTIEISLIEKECRSWLTNEKINTMVFSCSGNVWNTKHSDIVAGGQCLDSLLPYFKDNVLFGQIYQLWVKYHLNDLKSGNKEQCDLIEQWRKENGVSNIWAYERCCDYLKSIDKYEIGYFKYGHGWWCEEIPTEIVNEIKEIINK